MIYGLLRLSGTGCCPTANLRALGNKCDSWIELLHTLDIHGLKPYFAQNTCSLTANRLVHLLMKSPTAKQQAL
jgi:hypothetical protein